MDRRAYLTALGAAVATLGGCTAEKEPTGKKRTKTPMPTPSPEQAAATGGESE